jgi:predicted transglutaminase-like cysteine proteinase
MRIVMTLPGKNVLRAVLLLLMLALPLAAPAASLFDSPQTDAEHDPGYARSIGPRWLRVIAEETAHPTFDAAGSRLRPLDAANWRNLVKKARVSDEMTSLRMVNGYFNMWRPKQDANSYDTPEYWASPGEFVRLRGGDCEDYAIAKYFALRFLGVAAERMRVVVIRQVSAKGEPHPQLHAVLAVEAKSTWFILDNNSRPPSRLSPQAQYNGRFVPLYSMNEQGAWKHRPDPLRPARSAQAGTVRRP